MTVVFGLGMFAFGMTITLVGFFIAYLVASNSHNKRIQEEKESKKRKPWEA